MLADFASTRACRRRCGSTPTRRTASTAARSTTTSRPTSGSTSTTRRRPSRTSSCPTGQVVTQTTPNTNPPNSAASLTAWDPYVGYFQLSRFKFVDDDGTTPAHLDLGSEQQILRVSNNRQECCHVAGDMDFDKHNNLWMTTGDDTPAAGIDANGYGPFEDQLLDEQQTVRVDQRDGRHLHADLQRPDDRRRSPYNATAAQVDTALEALSNVGANNIQTSGGPVNTGNVNVFFRRTLQQSDQPQITATGTLTGTSADGGDDHGPGGRLVPAPDG